MRLRAPITFALILILVTAMAPTALAGGPGTWEKIGSDIGSSLFEPDAERTSDGYLHVIWGKEFSVDAEQIQKVRISGSGTSGTVANVLAPAWQTLSNDAKILRNGSGLQIVFSGLFNIDSGHPLTKGTYYRVTAGKRGTSWSDPPVQVDKWGSAYANYGTGATLTDTGGLVFGGVLNAQAFWDDDLNTNDADQTFSINGGSLLYLSMATDRETGEVWAAWYDQGKGGVWARRLLPSMTPPQRAPGSVNGAGDSLDPGQSVALVAPPGGGIFAGYCVGYPSCTSARVWEVGTDATVTIPGTKGLRRVALSSGPAGRVWAAWYGGTTVFASRSNTKVTKFGPPQKLGTPPQTSFVYKLAIEGSLGRGDVLVNAGSTGGVFNVWHTQVLPGLTLSASPMKWDGDASKVVTFTVTDAGQAVGNATVKVGAKTCTTGSGGTCKLSFPKLGPQKLTAIATKSGFGKDTVTLTVLA